MKARAYVEGYDLDQIKIKKIKYDDENANAKDIIIEFPERFGRDPISFVDVGLINACPDIEVIEDAKFPTVAIKFYGVYEEVE